MPFRHFLEEENERRRDEAENAEEPEVVRVSHEEGLLPENPVKDLRRLLRRAPRSLMRGQPVLNGGELLLIDRVVLRKVADEGRLIRLRAAGDESRQAGNPDAPAEVAHEIEEAAGVADLVLLERAHARGGQRDEDEADRDAAENGRPDDAAHPDAEIDVPEKERRIGQAEKSDRDQDAVADFSDEPSDHNRGEEGADTARAQGQTGVERGVVEQVLHEEREDRDRAVKERAEDRDKRRSRPRDCDFSGRADRRAAGSRSAPE